MMAMESRNPTTGERIREYPEDTDDQVRMALLEASCAFAGWRQTTFATRAQKMRAAADRLDARKDELARLMAIEMGKPLVPGRAEIEKCAAACRYYADNAERFLADEAIATDASRSFIAYNPLGPVLAVMPWNFPFWQVFRFAAPALMAGNVGLLKHASNVSGCALAIQEIFREAGFPEPAFRTLLVSSSRVGAIIDSPAVKAVTLTGSTPAGQSVASRAGHALKKTVLELGGSDPYVVLEDADLELAADACVTSRLINSGQSCIAAKRFIVVESVRERFTEMFVEKMRAKKMGDPLEPGIELGPLARADLRDSVHEQVEKTVRAGARLLLGGIPVEGKGAFYPPTVLDGVRKGMAAFDEEVFGPVAAIVSARDEDEAVALANDSPFGLGAAVFTQDVERGERIAARRLEAGNCFVNALVRSDQRLPFGGVKESGYGRELSHLGIREFVNIKTVYVK
jgi:succinate-semialdehyde dehydrogenase/glutarate-semialdehyde dehydrogenase